MVNPTQHNTSDPCLGGVLSGVTHHVMGYVRLGHTWLANALVEFCLVAQVPFFMSAICVWCSALFRRTQAEQRIAKFLVVLTHGSDGHSQRFDPRLKGSN
jgi:hypothetical protein